MKKIILIILSLALIILNFVAFSATCTLNTVPSPVVNSYEKNIDKILEAVKKKGSKASCANDGASGGSISAGNTKRALDIVQWSNYDIRNTFRGDSFFLDSGNKMLLPSAKKHDDYILGIQKKIIDTTAEIGGKCAGDIISFDENVEIEGRYKTKKRTLQEVLNDMYSQNEKVLWYYRDLSANIHDNEFIGEDKFTVAPEWFSDKMKEFYSPWNIQQCHDEDEKKIKIQETQKKGLGEALKYPQGIGIWKKAFELLLYGKSAQPENPEEANQTITAHAKPGGLWNSIALLNRWFQKIFWYLGHSQSWPDEAVRNAAKNMSRNESQVPTNFAQTTQSLIDESRNQTWTSSKILASRDQAINLSGIVEDVIDGWGKIRTESVASSGESSDQAAHLVGTIEELWKAQKTAQKIREEICIAYGKQAVNLEPYFKPSCDTFFTEQTEEAAV